MYYFHRVLTAVLLLLAIMMMVEVVALLPHVLEQAAR